MSASPTERILINSGMNTMPLEETLNSYFLISCNFYYHIGRWTKSQDGRKGGFTAFDMHQVCIVAIFSCTVINVCPLLKELLLWENKHFRQSSISLTHCPWNKKYAEIHSSKHGRTPAQEKVIVIK